MGRILTVDLTEQAFVATDLDAGMCDLFFGGRGLGIALLSEHFLSLEQAGK
jgi:aldehyde:ferredoxin oxidoreductase